MVILIGGASHTGKTLLAQRMLEKYNYPYLSLDHLKMGLIRSGITDLTPEDDEALTALLWPIVREMIRTVLENQQNLIVEGCYIPFDWRRDFSEEEQRRLRFLCLAMSDAYIERHFGEILARESVIESRLFAADCTVSGLKADNKFYREGFRRAGERVVLIEAEYEERLAALLDEALPDCPVE